LVAGLTLAAALLLHEPSHDDSAMLHPARVGEREERADFPVLARRLVLRHRERAPKFGLGLQPEVGFRALAVRHGMLTCGCH
jgi:hypothetical protein